MLPVIASIAAPVVGGILKEAAPVVGGILQQAVGGLTQGAGFNPFQLLGAIGDPLKALVGQAGTQLATPFRSIPSTFRTPFSGDTADQAIQSLGDIDGKIKSAFEKMQSKDLKTQLEGQQEYQEAMQAVQRVSNFIADQFKLEKTVMENSRLA